MSHPDSWYVAVEEVTAGPAATDLVIRGIEHRKIPPEALVCRVGARRWDPLATVEAFHAAVIRSYPPPPPDSEEARRWMAQGFHFPAPTALPRFEYPLDEGEKEKGAAAEEAEEIAAEEVAAEEVEAVAAEEVEPIAAEEVEPIAAEEVEAVAAEEAEPDWDADWDGETAKPPVVDEAELAVDWDETAAASHIDWRDPFESFFLVGDEVELPEEQALLDSLATASRDTFRDESAFWNLALCLAYGSDVVGAAAARAFFEVVQEQGSTERLEWMSRTLQGGGFVPSGIPAEAGQRAVRRLRDSCPPSLSIRFS